jgi:N-acyl-D-amino-acid deacylase
VIEAAGRYVSPGFIDVHSHSDVYLLIEPLAPSKIHQGITTEVVGNCGASAAPRLGRYRAPADWQGWDFPRPWNTLAEYREALAQARPAPNVVFLVGHNTLRGGVVGYDNRAATGDEMREMKQQLERALDEGARGFSTGLIYPPGLFAGTGEVAQLAEVAGRRDGIYASHVRNEGARLIAALEEFLGVGRAAGVRLQISHLKTSGRDNWGLIDGALDTIRHARENGLRVAADRYPYTRGWTDLDVVLPTWAKEGGRDAILARLRDAAQRRRLLEELRQSRTADAWDGVTIASVRDAELRELQGCAVPEAARRLGCDAVEAILLVLERDELRTGAFFAGMSEENMWKILAEPYVMVGTDASLRAPGGPLGKDHPHPRAYGTFPLFIKAALSGETVPLGEAIRKATSLPAAHFGLKERGTIAPGMMADVVIFSPSISDTATYADPHQLAAGVEWVIVNGVPAVAEGRPTGERAGRFL